MQRWLVIAGLLPLLTAEAANAQILKAAPDHPSATRTFNFRITQIYQFEPFVRTEKGVIAETDVMPNARIGIGLIAVTSRRPGPILRLDGKPDRSRKPAVTFVLKF